LLHENHNNAGTTTFDGRLYIRYLILDMYYTTRKKAAADLT
jgi:hypothetical protein